MNLGELIELSISIMAGFILLYVVWKLFKGMFKILLCVGVVVLCLYLIGPDVKAFYDNGGFDQIVDKVTNLVGDKISGVMDDVPLDTAEEYVDKVLDEFQESISY